MRLEWKVSLKLVILAFGSNAVHHWAVRILLNKTMVVLTYVELHEEQCDTVTSFDPERPCDYVELVEIMSSGSVCKFPRWRISLKPEP